MENNHKKRKYVSLSNENRSRIEEALKNGQSPVSLAQEHKVHLSTIYNIKKSMNDDKKPSGNFQEYKDLQNRKRMRLPKYQQVDQCLYYWFRQMRARDFPVTGDMILQKAEEFYKGLGNLEEWKPSNGFLRTFKNRYGISSKQLCGEVASADSEAADAYVNSYATENSEFDLECTYNGDETGLNHKSLPNKSLVEHGDTCQVMRG